MFLWTELDQQFLLLLFAIFSCLRPSYVFEARSLPLVLSPVSGFTQLKSSLAKEVTNILAYYETESFVHFTV
jgi:hypothetical protein